ncbi:hydrolase [Streptomyces bingchenggensis BCW-1]|uniref:Hydrolase n=1 Tax=Streptomyces bingchenggensis (strain BCW-1) TaxID=749414 RepID=D7CA08_STRBB|nr:hydrolase [Streptomyces bingchenggensis BCW-1]
MTHAMTPDGTRIAYQLQGQRTPLVLLAGQANNHHWWDSIRADFHPARSTLTLDYRGTGDSDKPDTPYSTILGSVADLGVTVVVGRMGTIWVWTKRCVWLISSSRVWMWRSTGWCSRISKCVSPYGLGLCRPPVPSASKDHHGCTATTSGAWPTVPSSAGACG